MLEILRSAVPAAVPLSLWIADGDMAVIDLGADWSVPDRPRRSGGD